MIEEISAQEASNLIEKTHSEDFLRFVRDNAKADVAALRLKYSAASNRELIYLAINQIECRKRFSSKLNQTLEACPDFLFPDVLAGEQSTSDLLADFHSAIVGDVSSVCDFTAGLGIDILHLAAKGIKCTACEMNPMRAETLRDNLASMHLENRVGVRCCDSVAALERGELSADTAFIDPARRAEDGSRIFAVRECKPDITAMEPALALHFSRLVAKLSPMLDVAAVTHSLQCVTNVYVIGTAVECKEIVTESYPGKTADAAPRIHSVTLQPEHNIHFDFTFEEEQNSSVAYGNPSVGDILVLPYPAVVKAGAYRLFAERYGLNKIAPNTHVYFWPENVVDDAIPGVKLRIEEIVPWQSKFIKRLHRRYPEAWVSVKNFGMTAAELQAKLAVKQRGDLRIIGVCDQRGERSLILTRPS